MEKIRKYRPGFILRMDFTQIPVAKANALKVILRDAVAMGYLESVSMEINLDMEATAETYKRTYHKPYLVPMPGTNDPDWGRKHWGKEDSET